MLRKTTAQDMAQQEGTQFSYEENILDNFLEATIVLQERFYIGGQTLTHFTPLLTRVKIRKGREGYSIARSSAKYLTLLATGPKITKGIPASLPKYLYHFLESAQVANYNACCDMKFFMPRNVGKQ